MRPTQILGKSKDPKLSHPHWGGGGGGGGSAGLSPALVWAGAWLGPIHPDIDHHSVVGVKTGTGVHLWDTRGFRQLDGRGGGRCSA